MSKEQCSNSLSWAGLLYPLRERSTAGDFWNASLKQRKKWACSLFANILLSRKGNENANTACKGLMRLMINTWYPNGARLMTNTLQPIHNFLNKANLWKTARCTGWQQWKCSNCLIDTFDWSSVGLLETLQATAESFSCKKTAICHTIKSS